jgi:hypothetical protein
METTATATAMEVRFPARRTLTSWVSPVRPKVSRSWPRVKAVAGLSSSPEMMSPLRKSAFSAGEAARIPVTTKVCRSSPLAREKKCCDHYF